ncbi:uncharacterized protein N7500_000053 [Penicillium coprophilum]|uniref:uncharacterized protein n=1 Tax=Penicillium coprophilum TaxID=36646 RepID=UPI002385AAF3|nr:uncharacterized protein N7500_000053 [Penicillium coprophilum]KAJ5177354.1 hypothetical protein N7500_000053 [Penicillium coprophilum]
MSAGSNPEILSWTEEVAKSVCLPDDTISLVPSSSTDSQAGRSCSLNPSRVIAEFSAANPRVNIHEPADPQSLAASQPLASLTQDSQFGENEDIAQKIPNASRQYVAGLRSEISWVNKVAMPLLEGAIAELPSQTESIDPQYQPRYTARDVYNRKVDLVVGLPVYDWEAQYATAGLHTPGKYFNHMTHPHTGNRVLGPGVEIKAADGNLVEAQVQIGLSHNGRTWKTCLRLLDVLLLGKRGFYIGVGLEGPERIWGPLAELDARIASVKHTMSLLRTLRRVMEYTFGKYKDGILRVISPGV